MSYEEKIKELITPEILKLLYDYNCSDWGDCYEVGQFVDQLYDVIGVRHPMQDQWDRQEEEWEKKRVEEMEEEKKRVEKLHKEILNMMENFEL